MAGPFPYNATIPQATDQISQSQPLLLENFGSINSWVSQNHQAFASSLAGQHNYVQMPVQASAPALNAGEVGFYNFLSPITTFNEMFIRKQDTTSIPITAANLNQNGWSYLPSGVLLKWGNATTVGGLSNVMFPVGANIPVFATIFQVIIATIALTDSFVALTSFTTTQINYSSTKRTSTSNATSGFTYLAIGM